MGMDCLAINARLAVHHSIAVFATQRNPIKESAQRQKMGRGGEGSSVSAMVVESASAVHTLAEQTVQQLVSGTAQHVGCTYFGSGFVKRISFSA